MKEFNSIFEMIFGSNSAPTPTNEAQTIAKTILELQKQNAKWEADFKALKQLYEENNELLKTHERDWELLDLENKKLKTSLAKSRNDNKILRAKLRSSEISKPSYSGVTGHGDVMEFAPAAVRAKKARKTKTKE
jgi:hypothetical protein